MSGEREKEKARKWVTVAVDRETYDMLKLIGNEEGIMQISSVIKYLAKQYIKTRLNKQGEGAKAQA